MMNDSMSDPAENTTESLTKLSYEKRWLLDLLITGQIHNGQLGRFFPTLKEARAAALSFEEHGPEALGSRIPASVVRKIAQYYAVGKTRSDKTEAVLEICEKKGLALIFRGDIEYPLLLNETEEAPAVLFCLGDVSLLKTEGISFAGSRKAGMYGQKAAYETAVCCAKAGYTVISGLARGVDMAAHKAALDQNQETIAVLPSSPEICYPKVNLWLYRRIAEQGLIISEHAPLTELNKSDFLMRNRIITGLSKALVVSEASVVSGSIKAAEIAMEQGREVFCVPGSLFDSGFVGSHLLIQDGCNILTSPDAVVSYYEGQRSLNETDPRKNSRQKQGTLSEGEPWKSKKTTEKTIIKKDKEEAIRQEMRLSKEEEELKKQAAEQVWLYELIDTFGTSIKELGRRSEQSPQKVQQALTMLEIKGLIQISGTKVVKTGPFQCR